MTTLTPAQTEKAVQILGTIGEIAAGVTGGPVAAAAVAAIGPLALTVAKMVRGEEPTADEIDRADAARVASAARMNAAAVEALSRLDGGTSA